jgi:tight adherence protein B
MLISVSDAMNTGYSIENAIRESYRDLLSVYGYDSEICCELRLIISRLKLNVNVETVIEDFASRMQLKNVKMFAQVFSVAKRTGGNMTEIIKSVTDDIVLKESVKEEIKVMVNAKKTEQKVMTVIPLFLIAYIRLASPEFLDVMYETWMGRIVMTVCIICYVAAFIWSEKIAEVEI